VIGEKEISKDGVQEVVQQSEELHKNMM